jgi:hypothetical protein
MTASPISTDAPLVHAAVLLPDETHRYAKCIEVSKRVRWEIERDVIRGRSFDLDSKFLPDGLTLVKELPFLTPSEERFLSQVQGRTYARVFGLVERFVGAKMLEVSGDHWLANQTALEALVRFVDEEMKHQELFRRIEALAAATMPAGYVCDFDPNRLALSVLGKSTWAVLALTCHIELFTQVHYRESIHGAEGLSVLYKDVFLYHWMEESQHAILDELEWAREHQKLDANERDAAVDDLIALVRGVDGMMRIQAKRDATYFVSVAMPDARPEIVERIGKGVLKAYRWQHIVAGMLEPRFNELLVSMTTEPQMARIQEALAPLMSAVPDTSPATVRSM